MDTEVTDVIYDSRKVTEGTMFVCMVGAVTDGHKYIPDAVEKGAGVIVAEREEACKGVPAGGHGDLSGVGASCTGEIRRAGHTSITLQEKLTTIGLTGTKGKTTTTYIIQDVLRQAGRKAGFDRNYRNGHRRDFYPCQEIRRRNPMRSTRLWRLWWMPDANTWSWRSLLRG